MWQKPEEARITSSFPPRCRVIPFEPKRNKATRE